MSIDLFVNLSKTSLLITNNIGMYYKIIKYKNIYHLFHFFNKLGEE